MTNRFVDIDLSRLPVPDALTDLDYERVLKERMADLVARLNAQDIPYDTGHLETDPLKITEEHASYFELLLKGHVNDAVKATLLASATGRDLEHIAARLGVERQVIVPADPDARPPVTAVLENDDSLRRRTQLAIEAFSTAGPIGAYVFFALAAHPHVMDVAVYDPHSGLCADGEVLVVIASNQGDGVPTDQVLDSVAEHLDARTVNYAAAPPRTREITRRQTLRPLTDKVIVEACSTLDYSVSALLKVPYGPDAEVVRRSAENRLRAYLDSRKQITRMVSDSAISAAVHVADEKGVAVVDDADITILVNGLSAGDVEPGPKELARATSVSVTYEVLP